MVWVVMWFEDMEFLVFSSRERAWNYLCDYYEQNGGLSSKEFSDLRKSFYEEDSSFGNNFVVAVARLIDEE